MEKLTRNDIKRLAINGEILYTNMNITALRYLKKLGYNSGLYGWNYDVYEYNTSVLLVGYRVPSYATYIDPKEVEQFAIKRLEEKIESMDYSKERLMIELANLKEQNNNN